MNASSAKATNNITNNHRLQPRLAEYAAKIIVIDDFSWVAHLEIMEDPFPMCFKWSKTPLSNGCNRCVVFGSNVKIKIAFSRAMARVSGQ